MMRLQKLNSEKHHNLKVMQLTEISSVHRVHMTHIIPNEYAQCARYYPLFLVKDPETGQFNTIALFGLNVDENLFIEDDRWLEGYQPLKFQSQPFFIQEGITTDAHSTPALYIDTNNPRVQTSTGDALFSLGKATGYLQQAAVQLCKIAKGLHDNSQFIDALLEHDLVEAVELEVKTEDQKISHLSGLYTINKDNLAKVPTSAQQQFERSGYVALITHLMAAPNRVTELVAKKNSRLQG